MKKKLQNQTKYAAQRKREQVHYYRTQHILRLKIAGHGGQGDGNGDAVRDKPHHIVQCDHLQKGVYKSPFACVWRIVIMVDAGAVADASAARTTENTISRPST